MVAFISGNGLGLNSSSLKVLGDGGQQGQSGSANIGRSKEQAYVNIANGNLILNAQDEFLAATGLNAAEVRTYNSQGLLDDDNADNWRIGVYKRVTLSGTANTAGSTMTRIDGDGASQSYSYDSVSGKYISKDGAGAHDTISIVGATWTWTEGTSRICETYDSLNSGRITSQKDIDGNTTTYGYTGALLTSVTTANNNSTTNNATYLDYTGNNLTQIRTVSYDTQSLTNKTLTRVRYQYDASNRLQTVSVDLTPEDNSVADGKIYNTTYTYDGTSKRVASISSSDGTQVQFLYDASNRVYKITQVLDGGNRVTNIAYDTVNRKTTITDPLNFATVMSYGAQGQLTQIQGPAINGISQITQYQYDTNGNLTQTIDARNNATAYEYDQYGNQTLARDILGNTITRTYGANNELLTETKWVTPDPDGAGALKAANPETTRYAYDSKNHLRFITSPEGRVTEYRYNAQGLRTSSIDYTGNIYSVAGLTDTQTISETLLATWVNGAGVDKTKTQRSDTGYDFRGLVVSITRFDTSDSTGAGIATTATTTQFVYDQAGQLLKTISGNGVASTGNSTDGITRYTYDGMGRMLATTDAMGRITSNQYDDVGNKITTTLANGLATTQTFNQAGQLTAIIQKDPSAVLLGQTKNTYDIDGRLRCSEDQIGQKTYYLYDDAGRQIAAIEADGTATEVQYNANNQVSKTIRYTTAVTPANITSLTDINGLPTNVAWSTIRPLGNSKDILRWNAYDASGRLSKTADAAGAVTEYQYNGASQLTGTIQYATVLTSAALTALAALTTAPNPSDIAPVANAATDRISRNYYDNDGKQVAQLDAEGYLTEFQYDSAGRMIHSIGYATLTNSTLRATGTLAQLRPIADSSNDQHNWTLYDGRGNSVASVDSEGYLTRNTYGANGNRITSIRYANKALIAPNAITSSTTLAALLPTTNSQDHSTSWAYTDLNQVQTVTNNEGSVTKFTYDSVGNLTQTDTALGTTDARTVARRFDLRGHVTAELTGVGYAALQALVAPSSAQIDAVWTQYASKFSYDNLGQRISSTDAKGNKALFYYTQDGQLSASINALGEVSQNIYNSANQLTSNIQYANRIGSATLLTLTGGIVTSALTAAVAAIADATKDSKTDLTYDARGLVTNQTDALGRKLNTAWTVFGQQDTITRSQNGSAKLFIEQFAYDRRGQRTAETLNPGALNIITRSVYDAFGREVQRIDGNSNTSAVKYDRLGRVVQLTDPLNFNNITTYDAFDRVMTVMDGNGNTTTTSYDQAARTMTFTSAEGVQTVTTHDRNGSTVTFRDSNGNSTSYLYDKNGNLQQTNAPQGQVITNTWDEANRLTLVNNRGITTRYDYDAANRVTTQTVDPNGLALITRTSYDGKGNVLTVTDANGIVTQTTYGKQGQVTQIAVDPSGLNLRTSVTYNEIGKTLTVTEGAGSTNPRTTQYTYDNAGRRTQEQVDPTGLKLSTKYVYDSAGNVIQKIDANLQTTRYVYDANNQLVFTIDPMGAVSKAIYDANGNVINRISYANKIAPAAIPATPTLGNVAALIVADNASDAHQRLVYDRDNRLTLSATSTGIDKLGNPLWQAISYQYDGLGNVTSQTQLSKLVIDPASKRRLVELYRLILNRVPDTAGINTWVDRIQSGATFEQVASEIYNGSEAKAIYIATNLTNDQIVTKLYQNALGRAPTSSELTTWSGQLAANVGNAGRVLAALDTDLKANQAAFNSKVTTDIAAMQTNWLTTPITNSAQDQTTRNVYDSAGRLVAQAIAQGIDVSNNTLWQVSKRNYDNAGHLIGNTTYTNTLSSATLLVATPTQTDICNWINTVTANTNADQTTRTVYDAAGRLAYSIAPNNVVTKFVLDNLGHVVQSISHTNAISVSGLSANPTVADIAARISFSSSDHNSRIVRDAAGRGVYEIDAQNGLTEHQYDACGNEIATLRYATTIAASGLTPQATTAQVKALVVANAQDRTERRVFDANGRQLYHIDAAGYVTENQYDALGHLSNTIEYATLVNIVGNSVTASQVKTALPVSPDTANDRSNSYFYDNAGNVKQSTDALGASEFFTVDGAGNRTSFTNKLGKTWNYELDAAGRVIRELAPSTTITTYCCVPHSHRISSQTTIARIQQDWVDFIALTS